MKDITTRKHPILFSIFLALGLVILISILSAIAQIAGFRDRGTMIAQGIAFLIAGVIVTVYMKKRDKTLSLFGFNKIEINKCRRVLYYIPLLIIAMIQPIMGGINTNISLIDVIITLVFCAIVGYTEETIFRGIIKEKLQHKGWVFYIVFSSTLFGILHMANALNGKDLLGVVLQIINALLIGFILALLITLNSTIIPLIVFHSLYDFLALMTKTSETRSEVTVVKVLNILYILYGIYLVVVLLKQKK